MRDLENFILIEDYENEAGIKNVGMYTPKDPTITVQPPKGYEILPISFKSKNLLLRKKMIQ